MMNTENSSLPWFRNLIWETSSHRAVEYVKYAGQGQTRWHQGYLLLASQRTSDIYAARLSQEPARQPDTNTAKGTQKTDGRGIC